LAATFRGQAEAASMQRRESSRNLVATAQAAMAGKRLDEAQGLFAKALELNPQSVAAAKGQSLVSFRLLLGNTQAGLSEKRFADAEQLFEAAVTRDATSKPALRGFARVASDSGQWPAALDRWSRFVETWPTDPHGYMRLLVASIRRADFSSLTHAIQMTSDYARGNRDFWFAAIMPALFRLGRFHEARQASELFPKPNSPSPTGRLTPPSCTKPHSMARSRRTIATTCRV
jgi:tetratricopeptide (TPR) repeat protein